MKPLIFCSCLGLLSALCVAESDPGVVTLGTNVAASAVASTAKGENDSLAHVACIFDHLELAHRVHILPWRRVRQDVASGKLDGYFTAMPRTETEADGSLSAPLVLENWYWFWRSGDAPPHLDSGARLAVIMGSPQAEWFEQTGRDVDFQVSSLVQLVKLLLNGRIDGFVADLDQFEQATLVLGLDNQLFDQRFLRYTPLSVYFSDYFIETQAGFLERFNSFVHTCSSSGFYLSQYERDRIQALLRPWLERWLADPDLYRVLSEHNKQHKNLSPEQLLSRDLRWQQAFADGTQSEIFQWLDQSQSRTLGRWQSETEGVVGELILMGEQGLNAAVSFMTSDYWQGDEAKFEQVYGAQPGELVFSPVVYDESTRRFQVHVGVPLYDPDTEKSLGVLSLGVDVELALASEE